MIVKIFSRKEFTKDLYNTGEFFICINSSGGPDFEPILKLTEPNVLNLWFDDVEKDEYKWGEDVKMWFNAVAITHDQADTLYRFIEQIPQKASVNIYCSKGVSRSGAVAEFLSRERNAVVLCNNTVDPNRRVLAYLYNSKYKYIQRINYKFDLDELRSYYYDVESNYKHLKWTLALENEVYDSNKHKLKGIYGWGIQSNLDDLTKPCPPYDVHKNGSTEYQNTDLVFGFAQKLLSRFPYARQLGIAVHPMHVSIASHIDNPQYVKVHFPIISTAESYFCFDDHKFVMDPGHGYLIDTRYSHYTDQQGHGLRAHLLLKLPVAYMDDALK